MYIRIFIIRLIPIERSVRSSSFRNTPLYFFILSLSLSLPIYLFLSFSLELLTEIPSAALDSLILTTLLCASSAIPPRSFVLFYYRSHRNRFVHDYSSSYHVGPRFRLRGAYVTRVIRVHVALLAFQSNFDRGLRSLVIPRACPAAPENYDEPLDLGSATKCQTCKQKKREQGEPPYRQICRQDSVAPNCQLTFCAGKTRHARREFFAPKLQHFLSFKYTQI